MERTMPPGHRIPLLVAVRPHLKHVILEQLPECFVPTVCHSLDEAMEALALGNFGMVLCSVQFDDNRLYKLLCHVRRTAATSGLPFVAAMMSRHAGVARAKDAAVKSLQLLGVDGCVHCCELLREEDADLAREQLREALLQFF